MADKDAAYQSLDEMAAEGDMMDQASEAGIEELEALRAERDEFRDKFMRALADAENTRKRADRDRREAEKLWQRPFRPRHAADLRQPAPRA